jgi:hypothetical protein
MHTHDEPDALTVNPRRTTPARPGESLDVARAVSGPGTASAGSVLELQRLAGNASVSRMISGEEQEEGSSPVLDVVGKGGGAPLDGALRGEMESRLGADFSDVRVHTDARASASAQSVQAKAYTVGSDVVFQSDQWSPNSDEGKQTLAHELTHVVQQRSGPVAGSDAGGGIKLSSPGDEFERAADATARAALAAPAPASGGGTGATAQRQGEEELPEEEGTAQGSFLQRAAAKGDEEVPEEEEVQTSPLQRQTEEEMLGEDEEQRKPK